MMGTVRQRNRGDRTSLILFIFFILLSLFVLPVLFSLKSDGTLGKNAPWVAIWSPMWLVDIFILLTTLATLAVPEEDDQDEDPDAPSTKPDDTKFSLWEKVLLLTTTCSFIVAQIFVLMRMDHYTHWDWYVVFIPWYVYEAAIILKALPIACSRAQSPSTDFSDLQLNQAEDGGEEDLFMQRMNELTKYFEKSMEISRQRKAILISLLRLWQSLFLAARLNHFVHWNWGLVLLPVWIYLALQYGYVMLFRTMGSTLLSGLDDEAILSGQVADPMILVRYQQGQEMMANASLTCLTQLVPLFMALMLIGRLESRSYSTFLIILPVFLILGCLGCVVCCGLCCLSTIDTDSLEAELLKAQRGEGGGVGGDAAGSSAGGEDGEYSPPNPTPTPLVVPMPPAEETYGTFPVPTSSPPAAASPPAAPAATSSSPLIQTSAADAVPAPGIDVDID